MEMIKRQEVLGQDFKVYGTWDEPLFLAKDVAEWIGHSDVSMMMKNVDEDEKLIQALFVSGQNREMWFLTEDGLYEVLMQSRKPIAKAFKKEVKAILQEIRKTGQYSTQEYSPLLQVLMNLETQQKNISRAVEQTNKRIDSIRDVVALSTTSWRKDSRDLLAKIAKSLGGFEHIRDLNTEAYKELEARASVKLDTRLTNKRRRMAEEGVCKSKRDFVSKLDIVAEDKQLVEIYLAIVKEMAVKYGVGAESGAEPVLVEGA